MLPLFVSPVCGAGNNSYVITCKAASYLWYNLFSYAKYLKILSTAGQDPELNESQQNLKLSK